MKKMTLALFALIFSTALIIATPPSGNPTVGTHWCENNVQNGDQEYVYEGGGTWSGPYACPNGCDGYGTGHNCKSTPNTPNCDGGSGDEYFLRAIDPMCIYW